MLQKQGKKKERMEERKRKKERGGREGGRKVGWLALSKRTEERSTIQTLMLRSWNSYINFQAK